MSISFSWPGASQGLSNKETLLQVGGWYRPWSGVEKNDLIVITKDAESVTVVLKEKVNVSAVRAFEISYLLKQIAGSCGGSG